MTLVTQFLAAGASPADIWAERDRICRHSLHEGGGALLQKAQALTLCVARRCTVGVQSEQCSTHRTMCSEAKASVPGWVAADGRLGQAVLSIQSDFDWVDLRSYDIRVALRAQAVSLVAQAVAPGSQRERTCPVGEQERQRLLSQPSHVRKRSVRGREGCFSPISAVSLLSRAFVGCSQAHELLLLRGADPEGQRQLHRDGTLVPRVGAHSP
jgi:hypothetical protein